MTVLLNGEHDVLLSQITDNNAHAMCNNGSDLHCEIYTSVLADKHLKHAMPTREDEREYPQTGFVLP